MSQTAVDFLDDVSRSIAGPRVMMCEAGEDPETALAVVKLALFLKEHPAVKFAAIVEDWDLPRIVRELY